MHPFRSLLRRSVRTLASAGLISPLSTARWYYRAELGRWPRVDDPVDFNEKLLWLQFNTDTEMWSRLADKYEVRSFVEERGLGHLLPQLYGLWDSAAEVDFDTLPADFALKATDATAQTLLVTDKVKTDISFLRRRMSSWGRKKFGVAGAEPHYARIPHRIIAEQLLGDPDSTRQGRMLVDYKFMCFNGKPMYCLICSERDSKSFHSKLSLYSLPDWQPIPDAVTADFATPRQFEKPALLQEMMQVSACLSAGFPFVRVDLYEIDGKIYFGEMTFTPAAARIRYFTRPWLNHLGALISIP